MKRNNKLKIALVCILLSMVLVGCGQKYTTVADDITKNGEEYLEIQRFEMKNSKATGRENIGYCAILIPSDFSKKEDVEGMYVSSLYPLDSSNIYYTISDAAGTGFIDGNLTKEQYEDTMEKAFKATGDVIDVSIDEFLVTDMKGIPCYKIRSHFNENNEQVQQLTYIIMASQTHTITYTQVSDDELMADFVNAEGEIKLVRERSHE